MVDSGNKQSNLDKFEALTKSRKASGAPVRRGGSLQMPSAATAPVKIVRSKSTGDLNQSKDGQTVDQADRLLSFEQLEQGLASLNHFSGLEDGQTRVGSLLAMPDGGDAVLESLSVALGVSEEILEAILLLGNELPQRIKSYIISNKIDE